MDKNSIKKFAVWARRELISRVSQKAYQYGITEDSIVPGDAASVNGVVLSADEIRQRKALIAQIDAKDYRQVMEEVAYTWFNRFMALRFMEVNSYLPSRVRVFTDADNRFKPQILTEAIDLELDGLDIDRVFALKDANDDEALFKYLLITQCNALSAVLPGMFQRICDYTELLFPDNLLRDGSVVEQMIAMIPQEDWTDQVQIIGWLYQYYNSEKKDAVFAGLKKNIKITKENIPAATQLFTPDWIVRYMVENSLGRLYVSDQCAAGSVQSETERIAMEKAIAEEMGWKYYLPEAEQTPEVRAQLALTTGHLTPDTVKVIDPCMGSGHILAYLFDVLMQIYQTSGYGKQEAVRLIIERNLYGLDIDDRAAQLAYFTVMMKARQYDRRFLARKNVDGEPDVPQPHVLPICESNGIDRSALADFINSDAKLKKAMDSILTEMRDAKEYGSILNITPVDFEALYARFDEVHDEFTLSRDTILTTILPLVQVAQMLARKYDVVVTNPPYMSASNMEAKLADRVKKDYPDSKSDLFAVFIERCGRMADQNRYQAMITQHAWMFLSSYEKLRSKLLHTDTVNMAHLGPRAFEEIGGEVVQTTSFVMRRSNVKEYKGTYCRLIEPTTQQGKEELFLSGDCRYSVSKNKFTIIPGIPTAYWISKNLSKAFSMKLLGNYAQTKQGFATGDNERFLRFWHEVSVLKSSLPTLSNHDAKWIPCNKGGTYRKWYGNNCYLANWENDGKEMKSFKKAVIRNPQFYYKEGITWSSLANQLSLRYSPDGYVFESKGSMCFVNDSSKLNYILGVLNSVVTSQALSVLSPTLDFHEGPMLRVPVIQTGNTSNVDSIVDMCIRISRNDWDSFETSWDFQCHPLISVIAKNRLLFERGRIDLAECFACWEAECDERFAQLKANEEELNRIFIDIYGLGDELTPEVEDKDVTVRKADLGRDIRSLISYAVGCMFGRYSLDCEGLAYAGGEFSAQWAVVGGQYYRKETVGKYVCEELSRVMGLAEGHGSGVRGVSTGQASSEGGAVRAVQPDAQSGSIDPIQHRRGAGTAHNQGIYQFSLDCQGFPIGAGDTDFDLSSPEILDAIASGDGTKLVAGGWKNAERIDWKAIHCALTTSHFSPTADNIIPICDDDYFADDLSGRFIRFIETVYGSATLEENLRFIADALGGKGQPKEVIRNYFLNDFYADHLKTYQKRPIYWLFDSGKKGGFKALIYMHRYQPDTIARLRTDYVHEQQSRYRTAIADLEQRIPGVSTSERVKLSKKLKKLQEQSTELQTYEEKIHHLADQFLSIDLDDGVKKNYEIFKDVLAKIK